MNGNIENMQSLTGRIKALAIDTTLTKKGMCAEAEATGKALATKVSITDIVDDFLSVATDKPLSANQGRLLKKQIDEIDPHNAENVVYGDTNVKNALDGVCGDIDDIVRTIGYTASKNILGLASIVGKTITHNGVSITNTSQNTYTINGTPTTATWFELGFDFRIDTVAKESPFVKLNSSKSYMLSIEQEGSVSYGSMTDGDDATVFNITGVGEVNDKHRLYIQKGETSLLVSNESGFTRLYMLVPNGATFNNYVIKIQLEEGTVATEFEPYVEDVKTKLDPMYNLEKISKETVFAMQTTNTLFHEIHFTRKVLVNVCFKADHSVTRPTKLGISINDYQIVEQVKNNDGGMTISFVGILQPNSTLSFWCKASAEGKNICGVFGYAQYLE